MSMNTRNLCAAEIGLIRPPIQKLRTVKISLRNREVRAKLRIRSIGEKVIVKKGVMEYTRFPYKKSKIL